MNEFEYIRSYYGVPAERGRRVKLRGRPGVIVSGMSQYIGVILDNENFLRICHPTWHVEYCGLENVVGG